MTNNIADRSILKEIDNKLDYIKNKRIDPSFLIKNYILEEANQHSARIEKPKAILYDPNIEDREKLLSKRELNYYKESLKSAWSYGIKNLNLPITEEFIRSIAAKIDPTYFNEYSEGVLESGSAPYRRVNDSVRPSGAKHTPPYPEKVRRKEMPNLIKNINELTDLLKNGEIHPVEIAGFAHFHLARIHPFPDVNGRTSRMIQNLILNEYNLPLGVLYEGERVPYHELLDNAVDGYRDREENELLNVSNQEKQFYNFIAGKVNVSLDKILDKTDDKNEV